MFESGHTMVGFFEGGEKGERCLKVRIRLCFKNATSKTFFIQTIKDVENVLISFFLFFFTLLNVTP